jgi:hypothetical protein
MPLPRCEVSIGITLNVGNYESVRADARYGADNVSWDDAVTEAEAGLEAALDGVERMLAARKPKKEVVPPGQPRPGKSR